MSWPKYALLALIAVEVLSMVALIGRPRRVLRPADAAVAVLVLYGVAAALVVIA